MQYGMDHNFPFWEKIVSDTINRSSIFEESDVHSLSRVSFCSFSIFEGRSTDAPVMRCERLDLGITKGVEVD